MWITYLSLLGGLALLVVGAELLVRGSSALALRAGVTPLMIGLTVVAFGTSSPELVVGLRASAGGDGSIALGNVVGSNICNIALILGAAALIKPLNVHAQVVRREVPILIGASALLWLLLGGGTLGRLEGLLLACALAGYLWWSYRSARAEKSAAVAEEFAEAVPKPSRRIWLDALFVVAGLGMLLAGAGLFVGGAVTLAEVFGVSRAVIGLTVVAVGTSLPELATSVIAAFRGEGDIAVGNAVGSSILNIFCILGVTALIVPIESGGIDNIELAVMTGTALLAAPLMRSGFCLNRWEGALLVAGYCGYIYHLVP